MAAELGLEVDEPCVRDVLGGAGKSVLAHLELHTRQQLLRVLTHGMLRRKLEWCVELGQPRAQHPQLRPRRTH